MSIQLLYQTRECYGRTLGRHVTSRTIRNLINLRDPSDQLPTNAGPCLDTPSLAKGRLAHSILLCTPDPIPTNLSSSDILQVQQACKTALNDGFVRRLLTDAATEVSVTAQIETVSCAGRLDAITLQNEILELKTYSHPYLSTDTDAITHPLDQLAFYQLLIQTHTSVVYPVMLLRLNVTPPYAYNLAGPDPEDMTIRRENIRSLLRTHFATLK